MAFVDEEMDEVVFETEVYLSKAFSEDLYLFEHPSKTANVGKNEEENECLSARFKPKQQKIELEMGINIHSNCYDMETGERIACSVDGKSDASNAYFSKPYMDKYIVCGTQVPTHSKNYCLGVWKNGDFIVIPLHSILELNPKFVHLDKMNSQAKKAQNLEEDEEEEAVAVTVRFEGSNNAKIKETREKSYQFHQQSCASEPWIELNYHPLGSSRSVVTCQKISTARYSDSAFSFLSMEEYLKKLVPGHLRQSENNIVNEEEVENIKEQPLSDQMRYYLKNAHIMTFSMLVNKINLNIEDGSIERLVHQMAVLVRGCWAVKSELLYPDDYVSPYTGVNSKTLINARDYILWLFTKSPFITRKEVLAVIDLPNEDFFNIISPLAFQANRRWEFIFEEDKDFIESHPDIFDRQNMKWDLRYKKLVKDLNIGMFEVEGFPASTSKTTFSVSPRPRQKRHSRSSQSEGDESGTDTAYGTKDYNKAKRSCISKSLITSPSKQGCKTKPCNFAMLDISPTFLESSPPADVVAELKEYVGDIMRNNYCMTLTEIKESISQSPLSAIVNHNSFEKLLEDTLVECGAQKLKNKWPQNTTPETIYAFTKFGNKLDRYRNTLLDLFSTTARARINLFVKKVEEDHREIVSDTDCRLLFGEYCVYKSGFYYLKGTIALDS